MLANNNLILKYVDQSYTSITQTMKLTDLALSQMLHYE